VVDESQCHGQFSERFFGARTVPQNDALCGYVILSEAKDLSGIPRTSQNDAKSVEKCGLAPISRTERFTIDKYSNRRRKWLMSL
jgi:hypothetical protein